MTLNPVVGSAAVEVRLNVGETLSRSFAEPNKEMETSQLRSAHETAITSWLRLAFAAVDLVAWIAWVACQPASQPA